MQQRSACECCGTAPATWEYPATERTWTLCAGCADRIDAGDADGIADRYTQAHTGVATDDPTVPPHQRGLHWYHEFQRSQTGPRARLTPP